MWKIDVVNLIKVKVSLAKEFHIPPGEIDNLYWWEYELFIKELQERVQEDNDKQKAEMDKYHLNDHMDNIRKGNYNKPLSMPKIPSINMNPGKMK